MCKNSEFFYDKQNLCKQLECFSLTEITFEEIIRPFFPNLLFEEYTPINVYVKTIFRIMKVWGNSLSLKYVLLNTSF